MVEKFWYKKKALLWMCRLALSGFVSSAHTSGAEWQIFLQFLWPPLHLEITPRARHIITMAYSSQFCTVFLWQCIVNLSTPLLQCLSFALCVKFGSLCVALCWLPHPKPTRCNTYGHSKWKSALAGRKLSAEGEQNCSSLCICLFSGCTFSSRLPEATPCCLHTASVWR